MVMIRTRKWTDLVKGLDLSLVYHLFVNRLEEVFIEQSNVKGRVLFEGIMPALTYVCLICE
jgi:hypothetical protein